MTSTQPAPRSLVGLRRAAARGTQIALMVGALTLASGTPQPIAAQSMRSFTTTQAPYRMKTGSGQGGSAPEQPARVYTQEERERNEAQLVGYLILVGGATGAAIGGVTVKEALDRRRDRQAMRARLEALANNVEVKTTNPTHQPDHVTSNPRTPRRSR